MVTIIIMVGIIDTNANPRKCLRLSIYIDKFDQSSLVEGTNKKITMFYNLAHSLIYSVMSHHSDVMNVFHIGGFIMTENQRLTIYLPPKIVEVVEKMAADLGHTRTSYIRWLVLEAVKKAEKKD